MRLERLHLRNVRNYRDLNLPLEPGVSLFVGPNAQGKSNLLEAVHLLSVLKSLRAGSDREVVNRDALEAGEPAYLLGQVRTGDGLPLRVEVALRARDGGVEKQVRVNGAPARVGEAVGRFLAVLFTAQDLDLALGPPALRRRFLDVLLSQVDRAYLRALQRYQRVLAQRNALLRRLAGGRARPEERAFWDSALVETGAVIQAWRAGALSALGETASALYRDLAPGEALTVRYLPSGGGDPADRRTALEQALAPLRERESALGMTLVGPHRDDFVLEVDGLPVGAYGSRGQARTVALALKIAEALYLARVRGDPPVLLLDDVLSELDRPRRERVAHLARSWEQALVTALDTEAGTPLWKGARRYRVLQGVVEPEPPTSPAQ